jgi:hypothetical protein
MTTQSTFTKDNLKKKDKTQLQALCKTHGIALSTKKNSGKGRRVFKKSELIDKLLLHSLEPVSSPATPLKVSIGVQTDDHEDQPVEAPRVYQLLWQNDLLAIVKEKGIADMIIDMKNSFELKLYHMFHIAGWDEYEFTVFAYSEIHARSMVIDWLSGSEEPDPDLVDKFMDEETIEVYVVLGKVINRHKARILTTPALRIL